MNNETINIIFYVIAGIIFCNYLTFIFITLKGWHKINYFNAPMDEKTVNISILIPFRNEANNLPHLIDSLKKQSVQPFEIIFIDDHSTDHGLDIIRQFSQNSTPIKILTCEERETGKKAALKKGLDIAQGEWVLQTDADCVLPKTWVETFISYIQHHPKTLLIAGPVIFNRSKSIFSWFFELDFLSLVFSGAGLIGAGRPIYCNGANMAYRRETAMEIGDTYYSAIPSGDDVFLLQQTAQRHKDSIAFLKSKAALVSTLAPKSLGDFLTQRIRWGQKTKYYTSSFAKYVAVTVFAVNILLLFSLILAFFSALFLWILSIFFIVKIGVDTCVLYRATRFSSNEELLLWTLITSILYPIYIAIASLAGLFKKKVWKDRTI
ncbi:MAG: hypothetical protein CVU05_08995 [Bacteroidetes bacterium HGW-Bacteroidetes-21]|nr:MAG: hypothetical protein CVU05_08995 [Bacteroidetes bacterium HGW-Bacteroidetes-21]